MCGKAARAYDTTEDRPLAPQGDSPGQCPGTAPGLVVGEPLTAATDSLPCARCPLHVPGPRSCSEAGGQARATDFFFFFWWKSRSLGFVNTARIREDLEGPEVSVAPASRRHSEPLTSFPGRSGLVPNISGDSFLSSLPQPGPLRAAGRAHGCPDGVQFARGPGACLGPRRGAGRASGLEDTPWRAPSGTQRPPCFPIQSWGSRHPHACPGTWSSPSEDATSLRRHRSPCTLPRRQSRPAEAFQSPSVPAGSPPPAGTSPTWARGASVPPHTEHLCLFPTCRIKDHRGADRLDKNSPV